MRNGRGKHFATVALLALSAINSQLSTALAQGATAFTYHGVLNDSGSPANGSYDLCFTLCDAIANGNALASLTNPATGITNGLFAATLDFGTVFNGTNYWLELAARTNGGGAFTSLSPRQPILPAPYALYAANAGNAETAATAGSATNVPLAGLQQNGAVAGQSLTWNGTAWVPSCDGSQLTGLNASALASGTVPDARLGANLAGWDAIPTNQFINTNIAAARGDLAVFDGTNWVRIGAGSDGQFLMASNATATGLAFSTAAGGGGSLATNYYAFATNAVTPASDPTSSTPVDGLSVTFSLPGARDVTISFSIVSTKMSGYDAFQIFDGFTAIAPGNGSTSWFSLPGNIATSGPLSQTEITASTMLNLASGSHTIKVQYRAGTGGGTQPNTFYDRSLQVSVH